MKNNQLFDLMSTISERHIEETAKRRNRSKNFFEQISVGLSVAACAILVVGIMFVGGHLTNDDNPAVTGSSDTTNIHPPIVNQNPDFIIENGVLVAYRGSDTEVSLPEGIKAIASNTFASSSSASNITTINLNESVKSIDETAFNGLKSLQKITVPENNDYFVFSEGVLMATDGSIHFAATDKTQIDVQQFVETIDNMKKSVDFIGKQTKFIFEGVTITAHNKVSEYDPSVSFFVIESFTTHGQTFNLKDSIYSTSYSNGVIEVNASLILLLSDDVFIYAKTRSSEGYYLIITKDEIYEYHRPSEKHPDHEEVEKNPTWYNDSVFAYTIDENGRLVYIREPVKYTFDQSIGNEMMYCVGRDEFAREEGYVTFEKGKIVYNPEKTYTISEIIDLDGYFKVWYDIHKDYTDSMLESEGLPRVNTLDELIAYNKAHYSAAK